MDVVPTTAATSTRGSRPRSRRRPAVTERARFYFRDGRGADGELPPNNWQAMFGGSAWTRTTDADGTPGQWYLHTFTPWQPDFDWDSTPTWSSTSTTMLRFWFDRGVDGFRIDAVTVLGKAPGAARRPRRRRPASPRLQRPSTTRTPCSGRAATTSGVTGAG